MRVLHNLYTQTRITIYRARKCRRLQSKRFVRSDSRMKGIAERARFVYLVLTREHEGMKP